MSAAHIKRFDRQEERELKYAWFEHLERQARTRHKIFLYRLFEMGSQRIGIPDSYFVLSGRSGWLEFKAIYDVDNPVVTYEAGQLVELRDLRASGVFSATLAVTAGMDFYIADPPRVLCNRPTASFNLLHCKSYVRGYLEDIYDALELSLDKYYKEL